jgi:hypothetical protein
MYYGFPSNPGNVTASTVSASVLQNYLNALEANVTKSGALDNETRAAWNKYATVFKEPHKNIDPSYEDKADFEARLSDNRVVYITAQALARIRDRAQKTGKLNAEAARPIGSKPSAPVAKTAATATKAPSTSANITASTDELQKIMIALGVDPKNITDKKLGPTTKAKWQAATKSRGLASTITGNTGATSATVNRAALAAMRNAALSAAPVSANDQVIATGEVQGLLAALGFTAKGTALTDGTLGPSTVSAWAQAATKRKLDPFIAKKSADGKQVLVRKKTYLLIKADADARVSPREPTSLKQMDPKLLAFPSTEELELLLSKLSPGSSGVEQRYARAATERKLDARIEPSGAGWVVIGATLNKLAAAFQAGPPQKPPPGPQLSQLEKDLAALQKASTDAVSVGTIRTAYNAHVEDKLFPGPTINTSAPWEPALRPLLIRMLAAPANKVQLWENALVVGKLVQADGKTVKLPPQAGGSLKTAAASLQKAKKQAVDVLKGFTEVNAASVIARINGLGITEKKFDRAGGYKELIDAIQTFLENSGVKNIPAPQARADSKGKVYVNDKVLGLLTFAVAAAQKRAGSTKKFRDSMVANALQMASGSTTVTELQTAFLETVESGKAGKDKALYSAARTTGNFDKPTRAAYTAFARTLTIGQAVLEYQNLFLGTSASTAQVNALVLEARNQVWNEFLDKAVSKTNGALSVKMLPALANQVKKVVKIRGERIGDQNAQRQAKQTELAEDAKALAAAIKKSTATLPMVHVQQGLSEMLATGDIKGVSGLRITGLSDGSTRAALFDMSGMIFPEGFDIPETLWGSYLNNVGRHVVAGKMVKSAWPGANYITLPPAVAKLLAERAGDWIAKHGESSVQIVDFKHPSVVTVHRGVVDLTKKEAVKTVESPKPATKDGAEEKAAAEAAARKRAAEEEAARQRAAASAAEKDRQAQLAAQQAAQARQAKDQAVAAAEQARRDAEAAALRQQMAENAGAVQASQRAAAEAQQAQARAEDQLRQAQEASRQEAQANEAAQSAAQEAAAAGGAATAGGAQVTGPNITITSPTQAGMGGAGMILAGLAGLAALMLSQKRGEQ